MASTERSESEGEPMALTLTAWVSETSSFESIDLNDEKMASPPETMENSPTDKPKKQKKGKTAGAFFRRVCKAVKRPFFCCDPERVVRLTSQMDALNDPEVMPRIKPTADADPTVPELVCLPGQVCEDPELPLCVPETSRIEQTPNPKIHVPDSSSLNLCDKKVKKGRKRKAVRAFFKRAHKAVKQLFPYCDPNRVQPPETEPDQDESKLVSECLPQQGSADLELVPVEEGPFEIEQDTVPPSSLSASVPSTLSEIESDTEPEPEIDLQQGSVVSLFEVGHLIASGNFSKVYEGTHVFSDKVKVAIKCIPKRRVDRYLDIAGHSKPVLAEVALMLRLGEAPSCPNIIQLHQWLEDESSFSLIMEYPEPCRTLEDYILFSGPISEGQARLFMLQVVQSVKHCYERGVYHGDIRSGNILVSLHNLELKLINFRCARLISSEGFNSDEYQGELSCYVSVVLLMVILQWLEDESSFPLIMEYPEPCRTLEDYILFSGPISEGQARLFMLQVVQSVKHCYERGVYHGDIRSGNILVSLHNLELKLINFRCARLISSEGFNSDEYQGSDAYTPPEVIGQSLFHAEVANVWAMGVLLFEIMHRYLPFNSFDEIQHGYVNMDPNLSTACHDLIYRCLSRNPALRLTLEQLEEHRWMKD